MNAAQPNADEEKNHFDFFFHEETTVEDLSALKNVEFGNQKPRSFKVGFDMEERRLVFIEWSESLLDALVDAFKYFKEKNILWEDLQLGFSASNSPFTRRLLRSANALSLFKKIKVLQIEDLDNSVNLCSGLALNSRLDEFSIIGFNVCLSEEDCTALGRLLQSSTTLKDLRLLCVGNINHQEILDGVSNSKSLETVEYSFPRTDEQTAITDEQTSQCVNSLSQIKTLRNVMIISDGRQFGDMTSEAIENLLSKTALRQLSLSNMCEDDNKGKINAESVFRGLRKNHSLEKLIFENVLYGDCIFPRLFGVLSNCPSLKFVAFQESVTPQDLEQVRQMGRLSKPIQLQFEDSIIIDNLQEVIVLLQSHPEVSFHVCSVVDAFKQELLRMVGMEMEYTSIEEASQKFVDFSYINRFNQEGRHLLHKRDIALSLWPLVIERVKVFPEFIYEFLKGPACAGRQD